MASFHFARTTQSAPRITAFHRAIRNTILSHQRRYFTGALSQHLPPPPHHRQHLQHFPKKSAHASESKRSFHASTFAGTNSTTGLTEDTLDQLVSPANVMYDMKMLHKKASEYVELEYAYSMEAILASMEQQLKQFNDLYENQLKTYNEGNHDIELVLENATVLHDLLHEIVDQNIRSLSNQIEDSMFAFQTYLDTNRANYQITSEELIQVKTMLNREMQPLKSRLQDVVDESATADKQQKDQEGEDEAEEDDDFLSLDDDDEVADLPPIAGNAQTPEELEMMQRMQEHNQQLKEKIRRRKKFFRDQTIEKEQTNLQNTFSEQMMTLMQYIQRQFFFMMLNKHGLQDNIKKIEASLQEEASPDTSQGSQETTIENDDKDNELSQLKQYKSQLDDMMSKYQALNRQVFSLLKQCGEASHSLGNIEETNDEEWDIDHMTGTLLKRPSTLDDINEDEEEVSRTRHLERRLPEFIFKDFILPWYETRYWNRILSTSVESRDFDHVVALSTEMKDYQIKTNAETYRHLVRFLLLGQQYEQVNKLLDYMRRNRIKEDAETQEMILKMSTMQQKSSYG